MAGGGREFLVKWKGYSNKETTWEPEANILEQSMIKAVLKKPAFGQTNRPKQAARRVVEPESPGDTAAPEPTRMRSSRAGAQAAAEAARAANRRDAESDLSEESMSEVELEVPPPRAASTATQASGRRSHKRLPSPRPRGSVRQSASQLRQSQLPRAPARQQTA